MADFFLNVFEYFRSILSNFESYKWRPLYSYNYIKEIAGKIIFHEYVMSYGA